MKVEGIYHDFLLPQISIVAELMSKKDSIKAIMDEDDYTPILTEVSREGQTRTIENPVEKMYKEYVERIQRGLRALGLNSDSKPIKGGHDAFDDFYDSFQFDDNEQ